MKFPKGGDGLYDRAVRHLFHFYRKSWVNLFLAPIILAVPPAFVTAFYSNLKFKHAVNQHLPWLGNFLNDYVLIAIFAAAIYPALILAFARSVGIRVNTRGLNVDGLLHLMATLNRIVGCKQTRFEKHVSDIQNGKGLARENVFCVLTQPATQIAELVRGICELFNALNTKPNLNLIRVILVEIKDGKIIQIPIHYPEDEPVRSSIDALNHPNSSIITAYRKREMVIIEDIKAEADKGDSEGKSFIATSSMQRDGSIICFPITYRINNTVPFVISIHCDQKGYFKKEYSEVYEATLQHFALRLCLEYSLLLIKEKLCEPIK